MRRIIASALLSLAALPAVAADMGVSPPVLRGALPAESGIDWTGFYFGGTGSYNSLSLTRDRKQGAVDPLLSRMVRGTIVEQGVVAMPLVESGKFNVTKQGFGVFAGYNWEVDGVILGVEGDYTRAKLHNDVNGARSGRVTSTSASPQTYEWNATTTKTSKLTDFGTISGRLGYGWGSMLPYVTGGLALGRSAETRSASIWGIQYEATAASCAVAVACGPTQYQPAVTDGSMPPGGARLSEGARSKLQVGYSMGFGLDYALSSNIFVRAAFQHIRFPELAGTTAQINQAKVGAAVKY